MSADLYVGRCGAEHGAFRCEALAGHVGTHVAHTDDAGGIAWSSPAEAPSLAFGADGHVITAARPRGPRLDATPDPASTTPPPAPVPPPLPSAVSLARASVDRSARWREASEATSGMVYARAMAAEQRAIRLLSDCETASSRSAREFMATAAWAEMIEVIRSELRGHPEIAQRIASRLARVDATVAAAAADDVTRPVAAPVQPRKPPPNQGDA